MISRRDSVTFYDSDVCRARRGGAMPTRGGMHLALAMSCLGRVVIRVFREVVVRIFQERIVVYACLATRVVCVVGDEDDAGVPDGDVSCVVGAQSRSFERAPSHCSSRLACTLQACIWRLLLVGEHASDAMSRACLFEGLVPDVVLDVGIRSCSIADVAELFGPEVSERV